MHRPEVMTLLCNGLNGVLYFKCTLKRLEKVKVFQLQTLSTADAQIQLTVTIECVYVCSAYAHITYKHNARNQNCFQTINPGSVGFYTKTTGREHPLPPPPPPVSLFGRAI